MGMGLFSDMTDQDTRKCWPGVSRSPLEPGKENGEEMVQPQSGQ